MRLLLITNVFPNPYQPTKGPFNLELARALAREHDVRVVAPISWLDEWKGRRQTGGALPPDRRLSQDGLEIHYPRYYYPPGVFRASYGWFFWQSVRGSACRLVAQRRPDVVLAYWAHPDGEAAVRLGRWAGVPAVVMVGGSDVLLLSRLPGRRRCISRVLHAADAIVTVSESLRAEIIALGIERRKVHVVGRGVDLTRFAPGDRDEARRRLGLAVASRVLLWVGRMVPVKGLDVLLTACAGLRRAGVAFHLYLVGGGPRAAALQAQSRAAGLADSVTFVGPVPHDCLADWYRAADYTVLPSRSEGIPNVLRESLACGTPFVASRVGGIPELAAGPPNRLVPPGDAAALAETLAGVLVGPPAARPGRPADWAASAEALLRVLRPLVPEAPQPAGLLSR